ncbi:hypothetical protein CDD82_4394 [Ophiocordyceps australis]|uniref:Secreted protein n=1 Tax=Ophiocordyceps australis TaxID=1399860 RepID=A0A2C5Z837_9HYPO|nr:hypothetical protein CDD82_4394 [Ophiocordyceps australis]
MKVAALFVAAACATLAAAAPYRRVNFPITVNPDLSFWPCTQSMDPRDLLARRPLGRQLHLRECLDSVHGWFQQDYNVRYLPACFL